MEHFKKNQYHRFSKSSKKTEEQRTLSNSFHEANSTFIPKTDKHVVIKEIYRPTSHKYRCKKVLKNTLADRVHQHIKKITHRNQVGFIPDMQGQFHIQKSAK